MDILPNTLQIAVFAFAFLSVLAAYNDFKSFTIPNRYCLAIAIFFLIYAIETDRDINWGATLALAGGLLVVGILLFAGGFVGAGDPKLAAAVALWAGPEHFVPFVLLSTAAGGGQAVFLWFRHRLERAPAWSYVLYTPSDPDFTKRPMAYGIPIAAGALYVAFTLVS